LSAWTAMRDLPEVPEQSFRDWWTTRDAHPDPSSRAV
jgi:hypothetical protein